MSRRKARQRLTEKRLGGASVASPVYGNNSGGGIFGLSSTAWSPSAWQADSPKSVDTLLSNNAVFACVTLIAADIGKLRPLLVERKDQIWAETYSPAFSPVLRKPNRFQNHMHFKQSWVTSKLMRGNTYVLLERDQRSIVTAMYVLDPCRVTPLVAPDGSVYYELGEDNLAGLDVETIVVPASEIIHDRMNCLFHPLVGLSPLYASGATADQGLKMQSNSSIFFGNNSSPGGVLTAPGVITQETAQRLKEHWEKNYSGSNAGRVAVLGDDLKFVPMRQTAVESQLTEQVNLSAKVICSSFHVPPFMIGLGEEPTYSNGETRTGHYYSQCLQEHIFLMEECLDDALGLLGSTKEGRTLGVKLDLNDLVRMDLKTQIESLALAVKGSLMSIDEARRPLDMPPIAGGDTIYMQQQNYSLEALNTRPPPDAEPATPVLSAEPAADPTDAAKALKDEIAALLAKHADETAARQAESLASVKALTDTLSQERDALVAQAAKQQDAYDASEAMAEALMRKFTRATDAA